MVTSYLRPIKVRSLLVGSTLLLGSCNLNESIPDCFDTPNFLVPKEGFCQSTGYIKIGILDYVYILKGEIEEEYSVHLVLKDDGDSLDFLEGDQRVIIKGNYRVASKYQVAMNEYNIEYYNK